ncbi:hypothetical protein IV203_007867 [Nitzschia inconspicua]|uniref:Uncharacterized protein n=1 Tax=Nitzschia inconspicua TaxID=303405 RepID=A0A9K3KYM5_9STRA|nr:hypothetical protein IV203_007867 [Nitzschia inconspicua]
MIPAGQFCLLICCTAWKIFRDRLLSKVRLHSGIWMEIWKKQRNGYNERPTILLATSSSFANTSLEMPVNWNREDDSEAHSKKSYGSVGSSEINHSAIMLFLHDENFGIRISERPTFQNLWTWFS